MHTYPDFASALVKRQDKLEILSERNPKPRGDVLALVAYLLLAIALTYPLILHFATYVPGDGSDDPALAWNLWWVPYSILNLQRSPIYTDYMFYPIGLNLAFYTLTYLNAFLSIPLQFAFNLVVAANVNLLLSFTLSGFGTYLLVKWLVGQSPVASRQSTVQISAFVAGAVYAFSSNKMLYASLGQFNIASSHWIPFYVLFLLKLFPIPHSPRGSFPLHELFITLKSGPRRAGGLRASPITPSPSSPRGKRGEKESAGGTPPFHLSSQAFLDSRIGDSHHATTDDPPATPLANAGQVGGAPEPPGKKVDPRLLGKAKLEGEGGGEGKEGSGDTPDSRTSSQALLDFRPRGLPPCDDVRPPSGAALLNLRYGLLLGLFLVFQALSEFIFASFLIIFTGLYLAYWVVREFMIWRQGAVQAAAGGHAEPSKATEQSAQWWGLLRRPAGAPRNDKYPNPIVGLIVAVLVFVIFMAPILAAIIQDMRVEGDFMQSGLGFADTFSSDLLGFFVPSHLHPLFRGLEGQFHFAYTNFAYLGFVALVLALVTLWKIRAARLWGVFAAIFVLISLGPVLQVNGQSFDLPLPFDLLLEIPFVKGNRYPSRWSVMVTLCLAVLVGLGAAWLVQAAASRQQAVSSKQKAVGAPAKLARQKALGRELLLPTSCCLLLAALLFEHISVLPLSNFKIPAVYETIAQDRGDFTVLEIPLAWRNGFRMTGPLDSAMMFAQWYQTVQRHPMLGGNTSRNPEFKFQYFTEAPVINSLIAVETGHTLDEATLQRDRELAAPVLRFFGVRYVVWHSPRNPANRVALENARAYVEQVLPVTKFYDQVDETGETVAYRVREDNSALPSTLGADDPQARLYFAEGWGTMGGSAAWATRNGATLLMPRDELSVPSTSLSFRFYAPMENQTAQVMLNDQAVGSLSLRQGWAEYTLPVPEKLWQIGANRVLLQFSQLAPTAALRDGDFAIGKTGVTAPASIVVRSAGNDVGDFAHVFVNGAEVSLNQRGYNVVVMDVSSGRVDASAAFDTFDSESESARLAQFISEIPAGKIVAVAARDEISRHLTPEAVDALRSIGAAQDLGGKWRWSHAILGIKGAPPGSALEAAGETRPAQIVVGIGAMEPNIAAAIEWVRIGK